MNFCTGGVCLAPSLNFDKLWMGNYFKNRDQMETFLHFFRVIRVRVTYLNKYVVKHKSAKLFMTYAVGKLEAALNISHLLLSTSSQS